MSIKDDDKGKSVEGNKRFHYKDPEGNEETRIEN